MTLYDAEPGKCYLASTPKHWYVFECQMVTDTAVHGKDMYSSTSLWKHWTYTLANNPLKDKALQDMTLQEVNIATFETDYPELFL